MRTINEPIEGTEVKIEPVDSPGIRINGVPATLDNVVKADVRVDLGRNQRSFVVEHVLGPLGLCGITAANITGIQDTWSFDRPEHRFCYSTDLGPDKVVGHPAGLPNPDLVEAINTVNTIESSGNGRVTVSDPVSYNVNDGEIELQPAEYGTGIDFDIRYEDATKRVSIDPRGENNPEIVESVTTSTTPFLTSDPEEAVTHAIADLTSDIAMLGGFDDLTVRATLGDAYHALTIGVARKAHDNDCIIEQTEPSS
ncbi:MAG: hypothetical protein ABEI86_02925 [Halobacteriaceae archaeon]